MENFINNISINPIELWGINVPIYEIADSWASHIEWLTIFATYCISAILIVFLIWFTREQMRIDVLSFLITIGGLVYHQLQKRREAFKDSVKKWEEER